MNRPIETYLDACRYLDDLQMHKIKLGLDAMRSILKKLNSPEQACFAVHVAGTNGKGSVCSMLQTILSAAGFKTGLYTSPHLSSIRERFRINDTYISEEDFTRLMERIRLALAGQTITYFECTTALAFSWFAEQKCDLVILETGMGGRLDATNVITPLISVITTISLDHEQYLGESVEAVAFEKAGIIKPGKPVISGVPEGSAREVIEAICRKRKAPLSTRNIDFFMKPVEGTDFIWKTADDSTQIAVATNGKSGAWQIDNSSCTIAAAIALREAGFKVEDSAIIAGIAQASWPGRMESLEIPAENLAGMASKNAPSSKIRFLLDGAHNQAGVTYLIDTLRSQFSFDRLFVIWASMADKNYRDMLLEVAQEADVLILTRPDSERAALANDLAGVFEGTDRKDILITDSVVEALKTVAAQATPDDLIVVAGSLYLIGEFRRLLIGEVVG